jgi:nicotinate-nucleotide adenylyltransferase
MPAPRRIGVFGGSFNPIHIGHLLIAEEARTRLGLDRVVFVPAGAPPHKSVRGLAPARDRLAMVRASIRGNAGFAASDAEVRRPGRSYTVDTLEAMRKAARGRARLFLIVGEDSVADLPGWRDPRRILRLASLAVATRPGADPRAIGRLRALLPRGARAAVVPVRVDVSATEIRERLARGRSVRYLVPEPAMRVIRSRGLYARKDRR